MSQIITLCATCADIIKGSYELTELDESQERRVCSLCNNAGYFSRYSFSPHRRHIAPGLPKKDTRAGMRRYE